MLVVLTTDIGAYDLVFVNQGQQTFGIRTPSTQRCNALLFILLYYALEAFHTHVHRFHR